MESEEKKIKKQKVKILKKTDSTRHSVLDCFLTKIQAQKRISKRQNEERQHRATALTHIKRAKRKWGQGRWCTMSLNVTGSIGAASCFNRGTSPISFEWLFECTMVERRGGLLYYWRQGWGYNRTIHTCINYRKTAVERCERDSERVSTPGVTRTRITST